MRNTPSEPGQPTSPKLDGVHCPICGKRLEAQELRRADGDWFVYALECPDKCALAAEPAKLDE